MRILIAMLLVVGYKSDKIPPSDKLEASRDEPLVVPAPTPRSSPPPAEPPLDAWVTIGELGPDLSRALFERLSGFDREIGVCLAIDPKGEIYATRLSDPGGNAVTDPVALKRAGELGLSGPLAVTSIEAERMRTNWVCTRDPGAAAPQNVAPTLLEGRRKSGDNNIVPDAETERAIVQANRDKVVGTWKMCLDVTGNIASVRS
ncbi:MAG: hypothetical protein WKG01_31050 [Kofleriaceae bacterium]